MNAAEQRDSTLLCGNCRRPIKKVGIEWRHTPDPTTGYLAKHCTIIPSAPLATSPVAQPEQEHYLRIGCTTPIQVGLGRRFYAWCYCNWMGPDRRSSDQAWEDGREHQRTETNRSPGSSS